MTLLLRRPRAGDVARAPVRRPDRMASVRPASGVPGGRNHPRRAERPLRRVASRERPDDDRGLRLHVQPAARRRAELPGGARGDGARTRRGPTRGGSHPAHGRVLVGGERTSAIPRRCSISWPRRASTGAKPQTPSRTAATGRASPRQPARRTWSASTRSPPSCSTGACSSSARILMRRSSSAFAQLAEMKER